MKLILSIFVFSLSIQASDIFWKTFGNGQAEVSTYDVVQSRYGELRKGQSVFIFVPEDIHKKTRVKVENYDKTPEVDRIPVLKLNRTLNFNTGIYSYAVMTSVFSSLKENFFPAKISITISEWCGNSFAQLQPSKTATKRELRSYFESEGESSDSIDNPANGIFEDSLPILIRELDGEWLKFGEEKKTKFYPTLWESRVTHRPAVWREGSIKKSKDGKLTKWEWRSGDRTTTYWTEPEYPHYIAKWTESDGGKGTRLKTLHTPYWEKNRSQFDGLRKELKLK